MLPRLAAVRGFVDAALRGRAAADDRPRLAFGAPRSGVNLVRIGRVHRQRHRAGVVVYEEDFQPRLSAVSGAEDAAFGVRAERLPQSRNEGHVGVTRIDAQRTDLPDAAQTDVCPGLARVG